jgi:hypothetical protein
MLSSNGTKKRAHEDRSHVSVFRQTGSSTSAMLSLSVSAAPLAVGRQNPITRNAGDRRYSANFHANSAAVATSHSASTHARRHPSDAATQARDAACRGLHPHRQRCRAVLAPPRPHACCCCFAPPRVWLHCVALPLLSGRLYVMYSSRCRRSASSCHSCTVTTANTVLISRVVMDVFARIVYAQYLDVAEVLRVELLHDEGGVLLRLLLQLRQPVCRRAQDDQLPKKLGHQCDTAVISKIFVDQCIINLPLALPPS